MIQTDGLVELAKIIQT